MSPDKEAIKAELEQLRSDYDWAETQRAENYKWALEAEAEKSELIVHNAALRKAADLVVDEFGCSIEQYHKIGPDYTMKDGTELLHASTLLDRAELIESLRALLSPKGEKAGQEEEA